MADNLTQEQRRKNMQHIKSSNTKIEVLLRKALWKKGYRYRKNYKKLPGKPDIVLTKYKIAIFCDGEFFHGKDWEILKPRLEKGNSSEYWVSKISKNRKLLLWIFFMNLCQIAYELTLKCQVAINSNVSLLRLGQI